MSVEQREKIAAGVTAARTGSSHSRATRERIAESQRDAWERRHAAQIAELRAWAAKAPTADARRNLEASAEKIARRTTSRV